METWWGLECGLQAVLSQCRLKPVLQTPPRHKQPKRLKEFRGIRVICGKFSESLSWHTRRESDYVAQDFRAGPGSAHVFVRLLYPARCQDRMRGRLRGWTSWGS